MAETSNGSQSQPAVVLGLTFLIIGLTFTLPHWLIPDTERSALSQYFSPETANVYACVAWAGWAHFLFAFRGQGYALIRTRGNAKAGRLVAYLVALSLAIFSLVGLRWASGVTVFGAVVWVYFIDHFLKAEHAFEGKGSPSVPTLVRWLSSYQPLLTFGWLSVVLLSGGSVSSIPWLMWSISLILGLVVLVFGGWKKLTTGDIRGPLMSLFFVGEALVWGAFYPYSGPKFMTGVYVFHIAAGSYFHYLGSYFVAIARKNRKDVFLTPMVILAANIAIIVLGYLVAHQPSLKWLTPVLGIEWFTLWVAVHLVSSDLFPVVKNWKLAKGSI